MEWQQGWARRSAVPCGFSGERKCLADVQSAIERLEEEWGFGEARGVGGDELGKRLYSSKDGNIRL